MGMAQWPMAEHSIDFARLKHFRHFLLSLPNGNALVYYFPLSIASQMRKKKKTRIMYFDARNQLEKKNKLRFASLCKFQFNE